MKFKKPEKSNGRTQPQLLMDFVEGLSQACSASGVLGNVLRNPEFWKISDVLYNVKKIAPELAVTSLRWKEPEMKNYTGVRKYSKDHLVTSTGAVSHPTKVIINE